MTDSNKEACSYSLATSVLRTRDWRNVMKVKFPNDPRNEKAAITLNRIAGETDNLTDEEWAFLKLHYDWSSGLMQYRSHRAESNSATTFARFTHS
jgi:hypothetical protein